MDFLRTLPAMKVKDLFQPRHDKATGLYAAIVAWARRPALYAEMGVPDTLSGRLEMLMLHLFLALQPLKARGEKTFAQTLVDCFFADVEANFRELGASDQGLARRIRDVEEIYAGRMQAYAEAVRSQPTGFQEALARNVFSATDLADSKSLADAALAMLAQLNQAPSDALKRGEVSPP
jgi:cytochrome b pre-mRNA-processing protein 3